MFESVKFSFKSSNFKELILQRKTTKKMTPRLFNAFLYHAELEKIIKLDYCTETLLVFFTEKNSERFTATATIATNITSYIGTFFESVFFYRLSTCLSPYNFFDMIIRYIGIPIFDRLK